MRVTGIEVRWNTRTYPSFPYTWQRGWRLVEYHGQMIMVDNDPFPFQEGEKAVIKQMCFRISGCWPLTATVAPFAVTLEFMIAEMCNAPCCERRGTTIDGDELGSMESNEQEGYFDGNGTRKWLPRVSKGTGAQGNAALHHLRYSA